MPKIIFIAATQLEADALGKVLKDKYPIIVCGMGSTSAAIATIHAIEKHSAELVVGVGIAGAIDNSFDLGSVVQVTSDYQADLGAYRNGASPYFQRFDSPVYHPTQLLDGVTKVSARTVSMACTPLINPENCTAQIESMEGAAVMAAAKSCNVGFIQLRAISNYIEQPRSQWKIELALNNLSDEISKYF